jgi:hypothetical protein
MTTTVPHPRLRRQRRAGVRYQLVPLDPARRLPTAGQSPAIAVGLTWGGRGSNPRPMTMSAGLNCSEMLVVSPSGESAGQRLARDGSSDTPHPNVDAESRR